MGGLWGLLRGLWGSEYFLLRYFFPSTFYLLLFAVSVCADYVCLGS